MIDITQTETDTMSLPTVAKVMLEDVQAVSISDTMEDAAALMIQAEQSIAAVVDDAGSCVGALTAENFVKRTDSQRFVEAADLSSHALRSQREAEGYRIAASVDDTVAFYMNNKFPTVTPDTALADAATAIEQAHAFQLLVVDAERRPVGILSAATLLTHAKRGEIWSANEPPLCNE